MQTHFIQDYSNTPTTRKGGFWAFNLTTLRENVLYSNDLQIKPSGGGVTIKK